MRDSCHKMSSQRIEFHFIFESLLQPLFHQFALGDVSPDGLYFHASGFRIANQSIDLPRSRYVRMLRVGSGFDVADNEIARRVAPGDLVACAGAGYANHAELVAVPGGDAALLRQARGRVRRLAGG